MGPTSDGNFEEFESLLSEDFGVQAVAGTSDNNMTALSTNLQVWRPVTVQWIHFERYWTTPEKWLVVGVGLDPSGYFLVG